VAAILSWSTPYSTNIEAIRGHRARQQQAPTHSLREADSSRTGVCCVKIINIWISAFNPRPVLGNFDILVPAKSAGMAGDRKNESLFSKKIEKVLFQK